MFRASSSDVSEFTDVAVSFVNTLTEQATETITVRTFPNQKPWVDRSIRDAVNKRTAAYNEALLSGTMSVYKASCYGSQTSSKCRQTSLQRENWVSFSAQWLSTHVAGTKDHLCLGNKSSAEVSADPSLAEELKHLLRPLWLQRRQRGSAEQRVRKQQAEKRESCDHRVGGRGRRALKGVNIRKAAGPDGITGRVLRSCADQLAGLFTSIFNESLATSVVPPPLKNPSSSLCLRTINPPAWMTIVQWPSHQ